MLEAFWRAHVSLGAPNDFSERILAITGRKMIGTDRKYCFAAIVFFISLSGALFFIPAQEPRQPVSFDELMKWVSDGISEGVILDLIKARKVSFELTPERLNRLRSMWTAKHEEMPSTALAALIQNSYVPPNATLEVGCARECALFVNGNKIGEASPQKSFRTSALDAGPITVVAKAAGFRDESMQINLKGGQLNILDFDAFDPVGGGLEVTCEPVDCRILLNDKPATAEQFAAPNLAEGRYSIEAVKEGWASERQKIQIYSGKTTKVILQLRKMLMALPDVDSITEAILEPFNPAKLTAPLTYQAEGEFSLKAGQTTVAGRIKETVHNDQITWEISPDLTSNYKQVTVQYSRNSSPKIVKSAPKDISFAETLLAYIKRMANTNPYAIMRRLMLGGGYAPRLEWWDADAMKPYARASQKWWDEGPVRLIAEYSDQKSVLKISKTPFDEFPVISELYYTEKNGVGGTTLKAEFHAYQGLDPYWPNKIILYPSQDSNDGFEIHYDVNSPRSIAGK